MIPLQEATKLVKQQSRSFGKEEVSIDEALGRTLSQKVVADRDYPPFNRATMDGIAINNNDWEKGIRSFTVAETLFAGCIPARSINSGECYKIMTGASVPLSANAVIRREDVSTLENEITVNVSEVKLMQNIAVKGQDIKVSEVIIQNTTLCNAAVITALASLGYYKVSVEKLPTVAIITTGDEVVNVSEAINEVQIRNSNIHLLKALLQKWKISAVKSEHVKDDADLLLTAINKYKNYDVLILSGAVSAGDADFVPEVLLKAGARKIFHKVAIRPGKPIWFGQFENGATVFALPGNPFSTLATFKLFIESFLCDCFGIAPKVTLSLPISDTRRKNNNLDEFFPVGITQSPVSAVPLPFNTSGDITAALFADALALHPADASELPKGETVACILL
jgi:molybdopterin molybdotransferase